MSKEPYIKVSTVRLARSPLSTARPDRSQHSTVRPSPSSPSTVRLGHSPPSTIRPGRPPTFYHSTWSLSFFHRLYGGKGRILVKILEGKRQESFLERFKGGNGDLIRRKKHWVSLRKTDGQIHPRFEREQLLEPNGSGLTDLNMRGLPKPNSSKLLDPNVRERAEPKERGLTKPNGKGLLEPIGCRLADSKVRELPELNDSKLLDHNVGEQAEPKEWGPTEPNGRGRPELNVRKLSKPDGLVLEGRIKVLEGRTDGRINDLERTMNSLKRWANEKNKGLAIFDTLAEGRERHEVLKDIKHHFLKAYDSGKIVTRMLDEECKTLEERPYDNTMMERSQEIKFQISNLEDKDGGNVTGWKEYERRKYRRRRGPNGEIRGPNGGRRREIRPGRTVEGSELPNRTVEGGERLGRSVDSGDKAGRTMEGEKRIIQIVKAVRSQAKQLKDYHSNYRRVQIVFPPKPTSTQNHSNRERAFNIEVLEKRIKELESDKVVSENRIKELENKVQCLEQFCKQRVNREQQDDSFQDVNGFVLPSSSSALANICGLPPPPSPIPSRIVVLGFVEPLRCGFENLACWHRVRTFTRIESLSSFVKYSEEVFILCEDSEEVFIPYGLQGKERLLKNAIRVLVRVGSKKACALCVKEKKTTRNFCGSIAFYPLCVKERRFEEGLPMAFDISLHHMGKFMNNKGIEYVGGEIHVIKGIDPDRVQVSGEFKLWWKGSKQKAMNNLRILGDDREAMLLSKYAEESNDEVEIYVQHLQPSQPEEITFLTFGEEAVHVEEMHEEVNMEEEFNIGDEEENIVEENFIVDEEVGYVGVVEGNVEVEDVELDYQEEDGNLGEVDLHQLGGLDLQALHEWEHIEMQGLEDCLDKLSDLKQVAIELVVEYDLFVMNVTHLGRPVLVGTILFGM
ncbi:hypothetical protein V8G54_019932 [Vigna mungo]|uniref:PB1-like domain-containing protein n=1 Tax=Vigna mungo TaxID=3915 RepID=A0AAQ3RW85_VIGMU